MLSSCNYKSHQPQVHLSTPGLYHEIIQRECEKDPTTYPYAKLANLLIRQVANARVGVESNLHNPWLLANDSVLNLCVVFRILPTKLRGLTVGKKYRGLRGKGRLKSSKEDAAAMAATVIRHEDEYSVKVVYDYDCDSKENITEDGDPRRIGFYPERTVYMIVGSRNLQDSDGIGI
ncbi:hypothetical protein Tco_1458121 [Tanacetum coccineum]